MIDFEKDSKASVLIKDREKKIEYVRIALAMSGLGLSYQYVDLIDKVLRRIDDLEEGKFSIEDATTIEHKWQEKWLQYHKKD